MSTIHACFLFERDVTEAKLQQMLSTSDYWLPDDKTVVINSDNCCGLAKASLWQSRLSELDQAYLDEYAGLMICANARIDNREELSLHLGIGDTTLASLPDNQLILRAYQKWGADCPKYLLGDFVFIIWDEVRQELYVARDHFGTKLLLFSMGSEGVMLSNEPRAFIETDWISPAIKESWLIESLVNVLGPRNAPIYHDLELVPPAHWLRIGRTGIVREKYWELTDDSQFEDKDPDVLIGLLKKRFSVAVQRRTKTEFPLSCELSEGLDSNGIAGMAAMLEPNRTIYTLSYQCVALNDETRPVWEKTYQDIFEMLDMHRNLQAIWNDETPDGNAVINKVYEDTAGVFGLNGGWIWHCDLASRAQSRVVLSGWGGDHCVTSYGDGYDSELLSSLKLLKLNRLIKTKHRRRRGASPIKAWVGLLMKHATPSLYYQIVKRRKSLEKALCDRFRLTFVKSSWLKKYKMSQKLEAFTKNYQKRSVKQYHHRELFDIGVESRLIESELSARQHRTEFWYPMLDVELVELAYNLPSELKCYQGVERYPFRRVLEGLTTKRIQWRVKADVNSPAFQRLPALTNEEKNRLSIILADPLLRDYVDAPDFGAADENMRENARENVRFYFRNFLSTRLPQYEFLIKKGINSVKP